MSSNQGICSLDTDGNGTADALSDGILILRYLFDPVGQWNYSDALGSSAARTTRVAVKGFLDGGRTTVLDVDGNGAPDALTDGILILRYLFDPAGAWNYSDALGSGATRTTRAAIKAFLDQYNPGVQAAPGGSAAEFSATPVVTDGTSSDDPPATSFASAPTANTPVTLASNTVNNALTMAAAVAPNAVTQDENCALGTSTVCATGVTVNPATSTVPQVSNVQDFSVLVGTGVEDQLIEGTAPSIFLGGVRVDSLQLASHLGLVIGNSGASTPGDDVGGDSLFGAASKHYGEPTMVVDPGALDAILPQWNRCLVHEARLARLTWINPDTRKDSTGAVDDLFGDDNEDWFLNGHGNPVRDGMLEQVTTDL